MVRPATAAGGEVRPAARGVNAGFDARWSPHQIVARLTVDHPEDENLRVSDEAIHQGLSCQACGQPKTVLVAALRRGGTRRVPGILGVDEPTEVLTGLGLRVRLMGTSECATAEYESARS